MVVTKNNIAKYYRYIFDARSLQPVFDNDVIHADAFASAKQIKGADREPAIMIHGIMKRSGTVYVGELLSLHPDVSSYPKRIWEIPFLPLTGAIMDMQQAFFEEYTRNYEVMGQQDFLPLFGAAFLRYLYSSVPAGNRMLAKMPGVQYLSHFYSVFPEEHLLLILRDGRDVVASTIKTWPQISFFAACRRWKRSAQMALACQQHYAGKKGYWLARYESAVSDPENFVRQACQHLDLDPERYPFEAISTLPVIGSSTTRKQGITWMKKTDDFKPLGRWRKWSPLKKAIFKLIDGRSLIALGYSDNLAW